MSGHQHPETQLLPTQSTTYRAPVDSAGVHYFPDEFNLHVEHVAAYGDEKGSYTAYQDMYHRHDARLEKEQLEQVEGLSPSTQDSTLPCSSSNAGEVSLIECTVFGETQATLDSQVDVQGQRLDWPFLADGGSIAQLDSTTTWPEDLPSSKYSDMRHIDDTSFVNEMNFSTSGAIPPATCTDEAASGEDLPPTSLTNSPEDSDEFGTCLALQVADSSSNASREEEFSAVDSKEDVMRQQQQQPQQHAMLHSIEEQLSLLKHTLDEIEKILQLDLVDEQHLLEQFAAVDFSQVLNCIGSESTSSLHTSSSNGEESFATTSVRFNSTNPFSQAYLRNMSAESSFVGHNDIALHVSSKYPSDKLATNDSFSSKPTYHLSMPIARDEVAHEEPGEGVNVGYTDTRTTSIASKLSAIEANIVTLSGTFNMHLRKLDLFMQTYKQHDHIQGSWRPHVGNVYDQIRRYFLTPPSAANEADEIYPGQSHAPTSRIQTDHVRRIINDPAVRALVQDQLRGFHLMLLDQICVRLLYAYLYNIQSQFIDSTSNRCDLEQRPFNPLYQEPLAPDFASTIYTYSAALLYHCTRDATSRQEFCQFGWTLSRLGRFLDYLSMLMVLHLEMRYFLRQYVEDIVDQRLQTDVSEERTISTKIIQDKFDEICQKWNVTKALLNIYRHYIGAQDFSQWYHMLLQLRNQ